jgi:uncharacterized protein (TIGR02246 family)
MTTTSPPPTATDPASDLAAIAAIPQRVVAAWAAHDAGAFAGVFTEDGTMILPGLYLKGQDAIRSHMAAAFEGEYKDTRVTGQPIDLKVLSTDAAALITHGGVLAPGESELSDDSAIRASWVVVRQEGQWRLALYQNSPRDVA